MRQKRVDPSMVEISPKPKILSVKLAETEISDDLDLSPTEV